MDQKAGQLTAQEKVEILAEEYRVLYGLVLFRMTSLDRRLPVTGAAVTALLGGTFLAPEIARAPLLIGVPVVLLWLMRTTINHARSLEDLFRRIEEIEKATNRLAGEELLCFQSCHPSRHKAVGGRTGQESVSTVLASCLLLLSACLYLAGRVAMAEEALLYTYGAYVLLVGVTLVSLVASYSRYGYRGLVRSEESRSTLL